MKRVLFALMFMLMAGGAVAQGCAVCTKTAAELGDKSAKGLNGGIIYLAFIPLGIIGTVSFLWWKYNRQSS
jgi:heme/copper-type cytochrome/quinol oxidase subunit 2